MKIINKIGTPLRRRRRADSNNSSRHRSRRNSASSLVQQQRQADTLVRSRALVATLLDIEPTRFYCNVTRSRQCTLSVSWNRIKRSKFHASLRSSPSSVAHGVLKWRRHRADKLKRQPSLVELNATQSLLLELGRAVASPSTGSGLLSPTSNKNILRAQSDVGTVPSNNASSPLLSSSSTKAALVKSNTNVVVKHRSMVYGAVHDDDNDDDTKLSMLDSPTTSSDSTYSSTSSLSDMSSGGGTLDTAQLLFALPSNHTNRHGSVNTSVGSPPSGTPITAPSASATSSHKSNSFIGFLRGKHDAARRHSSPAPDDVRTSTHLATSSPRPSPLAATALSPGREKRRAASNPFVSFVERK